MRSLRCALQSLACLVLSCVDFEADPEDTSRLLDVTRSLGLIVARGSAIVLISPVDGVQRIENPFLGVEA